MIAAAPGRPEATLAPPIAPFPTCPNLGYMFSSPTGSQTTYSYYDIGSATLVPIKDLTLEGNGIVVNAAGYSNTQNVFWAVRALRNPPKPDVGPFPDEIVRVDSEGNVADIGAPTNLGALGYPDFLALAGTVQGDVMYVHTKEPANHLFQIDVNPTSATLGTIIADRPLSRMSPGNPDSMLNIGDWDYNDADGQLYGVELSGGKRKIIKVDPANGNVTDVADLSTDLPDSDNYGAVFMEDGTSNFYVAANNLSGTGKSQTFMARLDLSPAFVQPFKMGEPLRINDGADCLLATDFGDAPETYKTTTLGGGPAHVMSQVFNPSNRYWLGAMVDSDIDGFPSDAADTDDVNIPDSNDEDAIPAGTELNSNGPTVTVQVTNNTGRAGLLAGWLDTDADGTFGSAERATAAAPSSDGSATLTWPAVENTRLARAGQTMLRLRLYADPATDAQPTGWVDGGEMEDHVVTLAAGQVPPVVGNPPGPGNPPVVGNPPGTPGAPNVGLPPGAAPPPGWTGAPGDEWDGGDYYGNYHRDAEGNWLPVTGNSVTRGIAIGAGLVLLGALILGSVHFRRIRALLPFPRR